MRLIDADDLKKYIEKLQNETRDMKEMVRFDGILAILDSQPTIEPKRGKWIDEGGYLTTAYGSLHSYTCSECGAGIIIENYDNFCQNCGAKMEGDSRNSERRWGG